MYDFRCGVRMRVMPNFRSNTGDLEIREAGGQQNGRARSDEGFAPGPRTSHANTEVC
jgi:hypothetical protein